MSKEQNRISWHPAFRAAAELEFKEDINDLIYESEHSLSKEPLRIDLLILHLKNHKKILHSEIGKLMRKHNIIEYKGIFYISGFPFPLQIVVFNLVDKKLHSAFRLLSRKANISTIKEFLHNTRGMNTPQDMNNINAILQVSYNANKEIYEKIRKGDSDMCEALRDLFKDELEEQYQAGEAKGISQGISRGIATTIKNMQENNFTMQQIMLATGKTETEINEILESA